MRWIALLVTIGVLAAPASGAGQVPDSVLRQTATGALYHRNCVPPGGPDPLIVYLQGTGLGPGASRQFLRHVGDRTGRCVVAVAYENAKLVASYCIADRATGAQDPECLTAVLGAKAAGEPARVDTRTGGVLEVPRGRSAEGALLEALQILRLTTFLSADQREIRWDQVVLTGASQGAQVALFIAATRHRVAGVGSIAGGVLRTTGASPFPPFVYQRGLTPPANVRAFHHGDDADGFRREVYAAMGVPDANIRTTAVTGGDCAARPHPCVIIDDYLPMGGGRPKVVDDWLWVATPER